jgi:tagaturonate epimerase
MKELLQEKIRGGKQSLNELFELKLKNDLCVRVYSNSITEKGNIIYFLSKEENEKYLYLYSRDSNSSFEKFNGELYPTDSSELLKKCSLTTENRMMLQNEFNYLVAKTLGVSNSFRLGDRIGLANAGHIRSILGSGFKPILAQQSIRELTRTNRTAAEVMDAAVWAVFQEGYKDGFGSDADHLKTYEDIDIMLASGFTMFTFDPSEHVDNNADYYDEAELNEVVGQLRWDELKDSYTNAEDRYSGRAIKISDKFSISVSKTDFLRAYAKYGRSIAHIKKMYDYLSSKCSADKFEIEVSVDETESVTTPFEHFFFANELNRLKIIYVSLAPRFIGDFEKGIDYKGDLTIFKQEYEKHLAITKHFKSYKISLHSGSDKFSVYKVIGSLREAYTHVKTAGTSYLEALKVVAIVNPKMFREIYDFCYGLYETEKKSYHVSADISRLKTSAKEYSDNELINLFNSNDARQLLHVTFGKVLTTRNDSGNYLFKDRIISCLKENEEVHYELIVKHFHKHIEPFK